MATANIAKHVETIRIRNQHAAEITFCLEPWGEEYALPIGGAIEVTAEGPAEDALEVELAEDRIAVYGWSGFTVSLFRDGDELDAGHGPRSRVPLLPGTR